MRLRRQDITENVIELLAWKKAAKILYGNENDPTISLVKLLMAELNIHEATARDFVNLFRTRREEIVRLIETDPFKKSVYKPVDKF